MSTNKKPDNVVFDKASRSYNAALKPYANAIGAPAIKTNDTAAWKNRNIQTVNKQINAKYVELKAEYEAMMEQFEYYSLVYSAKFNFGPIVGSTYNQYRNKKKDIADMDRIRRIKYISSVSGIKPANLIGTISEEGQTNLAIFSSVFHLGSDPALLGFITRPAAELARHTFENLNQNKHYTINHVPRSFSKNAHYTSAKLERNRSEFEVCGFTAEFVHGFAAPFVQESALKMGMVLKETINIQRNGTILVIGEIEHLIMSKEAIDNEDDVNLAHIKSVGISGSNTYYDLKKIVRSPMRARGKFQISRMTNEKKALP